MTNRHQPKPYYPPLPPEKTAQAIALLTSGLGVCATARAVGCSDSTISRLREREGIESAQSFAQNRATLAAKHYARHERLRLINDALATAEALLPTVKSAAAVERLAKTIDTLCSAMRAEEQAAHAEQAAAEQNSAGSIEALRAKIVSKIGEVAEREALVAATPYASQWAEVYDSPPTTDTNAPPPTTPIGRGWQRVIDEPQALVSCVVFGSERCAILGERLR